MATQNTPYFIPTLYATDKTGFLYDIRTLSFSHIPDATVQGFFTQIDQLRKHLSQQREDAARYRRLCNHLSSVRNASDYERLFLIRYQADSRERPALRTFLRKISLGGFVKVIFKISYAELVAIEQYLDDFAAFIGDTHVSTRHVNRLAHLKEYESFTEELAVLNDAIERRRSDGVERCTHSPARVAPPPEPEACGFVFSRGVGKGACVEGGESDGDVVMGNSLATGPDPSNSSPDHAIISSPADETPTSEEVNPKAITTVNNLSGRTILGFLSRHLAPVKSISMSMEEAHGVISLNLGLGPPNWDPKCIRIQLTLDLAHSLVRYALRVDG